MPDWPLPNKHGVFMRDQCESLRCDVAGRSYVEILLIQVGEQEWCSGFDIRLPDRGGGFWPGIGQYHSSFPTRNDALSAELDAAIKYCEGALSDFSPTQVTIAHARRIITWCRRQFQFSLF